MCNCMMYICLCVASLFGGSSGFAAASSSAPAAAAPQSSGFMSAGGQTTTSGFPFGAAALSTQPQTSNINQTGVGLSAFSLQASGISTGQPGASTGQPGANTGQPGGFQFGSSTSAAGGFNLSAGLLPTSGPTTTAAGGFMFGAVPSAGSGLTAPLGSTGQTGASSLFTGAKPGSCAIIETLSALQQLELYMVYCYILPLNVLLSDFALLPAIRQYLACIKFVVTLCLSNFD